MPKSLAETLNIHAAMREQQRDELATFTAAELQAHVVALVRGTSVLDAADMMEPLAEALPDGDPVKGLAGSFVTITRALAKLGDVAAKA